MALIDVIALDALLHEPDPADLVGRGSRVTCAGDPRRRQTVLLPLLTRWAQRRFIDHDPAPFIAPAKKGFQQRTSAAIESGEQRPRLVRAQR